MKTLIVGGGITGLAAAFELQKAGHEVLVLEAGARAGGRGQILTRPGSDDAADVGTQYFHSNYKRAFHLIERLGLSGELKKITGKTRMWTEQGRSALLDPKLPYFSFGSLWQNMQAFWYLLKTVGFNRTSVYGIDPDTPLDHRPALDSTSSKFVQDYVVRMLNITGGLREPGAAQTSQLHILRLARIILMTDYVSLKNGTASLHAALAARLPIRTDTPVEKVLREGDRVIGVETRDGERFLADHTIIATHAPAAAQLCPAAWEAEKSFLASIDMPPAIIVSFFLNRPLEENVWSHYFPINGEQTVSFCVDTHQKNPQNTPSGKATLQAWITSPQAERLANSTDAQIAEIAKADMAAFIPDALDAIDGFHVTRHAHSVPQSPVGHNHAAHAFLQNVNKREGISFCGDYLSGGYLECALWSVERMMAHLPKS